MALYQHESPYPPGGPLLIHVTLFPIYDVVTIEEEVEASVRRLKRHKSGGHTNLRTEYLQGLIQDSYSDRETTPPKYGLMGETGEDGAVHVVS